MFVRSLLAILTVIPPLTWSWAPDVPSSPSLLDLPKVNRIWTVSDNPGDYGKLWGVSSDKTNRQIAQSDEDCEEPYYDGMSNDVLCWVGDSPPSQVQKARSYPVYYDTGLNGDDEECGLDYYFDGLSSEVFCWSI